MNKRPAEQFEVGSVVEKRARYDLQQVSTIGGKGKELAVISKKHFLKGAIMLLTGHDGEVFSSRFHPNGTAIASAGSDRSIYLWSTRGDCENYAILKAAHSNSILQLEYSSDGERLFSCSADKTVSIWDSATGCRLKKLRNHQTYVNSISATPSDPNLLVSVADDCYINVWDLRTRKCAYSFRDKYQLTAVAFNNDQVFVGGIENLIKVWDLRRGGFHYSMAGHLDTITGLSLSPDGHHLLSNSMDNTLKSWDVRPFAPVNRLEKTFLGHQHNFEKNLLRCSWSPNGNMVAAGSSDRIVYIWSYNTCDILYKLPGHRGSVNEVCFSPREPLVLSCSSDKQIYLGEINYDSI